jgi:hypothetical protein
MLAIRGTGRVVRQAGAALAAVLLALGVITTASAAAAATHPAHPAHPAHRSAPHVMVIWMENTDYSQMAASPAMPELNQLAHEYASFTRAYGWHYPSLPNYIELLAGSDLGVTSDCDITDKGCSGFHHEKIVNQLEAAGLSWHAYYQGDPSGCYQGDGSGNYPYWHNSFRYFADFKTQCKHISNFGPLLSDLSGPRPPDFNWVVPDLVNSGGDNGTMNSGDSWLAGELPKIMATSWYRNDGQIVIIYDTGYNDTGGNGGASAGQIPVVVVSGHDRGIGPIAAPVNTAGVLRSIEHAYGFRYIGNAASPANGSLGRALVSGWSGRPGGRARQILRGALVSGLGHVGIVGGTLGLQGVYRFPGSRRTIEVGNNGSGEGVIAASGHRIVAVRGTSDLESVSCPTAGTCYAVGLATSAKDEAVLVRVVNGQPRSVTDLPAFIGLYGIACPGSTCYAVGYDNAGDAGAVTTITGGTASAPAEVPADGNTPWLNAISCPTSTQCYAAGLANYVPAIVPITSGVPQAAVNVASGWYLNGIDCPTVGNCVAVGENATEQGIVATLVGGAAGTTTVVPGTEYLYGVGCAADGSCLLAGNSIAGLHDYGAGVLVPYTAGTPGKAFIVRGANGLGQTVCALTTADCVSAGAAFRS